MKPIQKTITTKNEDRDIHSLIFVKTLITLTKIYKTRLFSALKGVMTPMIYNCIHAQLSCA